MDNTQPLPLPRGFCDACLRELLEQRLEGVQVHVFGSVKIVGAYCSHNAVTAIRKELDEHNVGPWRMVSPAAPEDLVVALRMAAAAVSSCTPPHLEPSKLN